MDDVLSTIKGATELMIVKDGDPPVFLEDAGIRETVELDVAPSRAFNARGLEL